MREIKFKAKRKDNQEWVYGYLIKSPFENYYIYPILDKRYKNWEHSPLVQVIPKTICEYTGLKDKNGVEIYENDIIRHKTIYSDEIGKDTVFFNEDYGTFEAAINGNKKDSEVLGFYLSRLSIDTNYEVIDNLYDEEVE